MTRLYQFEKNERVLADKLLRNFETIEDYYFTSGRTCYDIEIITKSERHILGEVKVRGFKIDKYPDYILQVDKLKSLCYKAKQKGIHTIYYINFFETDLPEFRDFIVFDLTPRIKQWQVTPPIIIKKWMNAETCTSTTYKIEKDVIMLEFDEKTDMKGQLSLN